MLTKSVWESTAICNVIISLFHYFIVYFVFVWLHRQCIIYWCCLDLECSVQCAFMLDNCACMMEIDNSVEVILSVSVHVISNRVCCTPYASAINTADTANDRNCCDNACLQLRSYRIVRTRFKADHVFVWIAWYGWISLILTMHTFTLWAFTTAFMCIASHIRSVRFAL